MNKSSLYYNGNLFKKMIRQKNDYQLKNLIFHYKILGIFPIEFFWKQSKHVMHFAEFNVRYLNIKPELFYDKTSATTYILNSKQLLLIN